MEAAKSAASDADHRQGCIGALALASPWLASVGALIWGRANGLHLWGSALRCVRSELQTGPIWGRGNMSFVRA
eukprot:13028049-Alexandrium_andersonii.AAC.1